MKRILPIAGAVVLIAAASGCATKKDVRAAVGPLDERLGRAEGQNTEQTEALQKMEEQWKTDVGRLEEIANNAQRDATGAGNRADTAQQKADTAMNRANSAYSVGEQAANTAQTALDRLSNIGNYRMFDEATILFSFDSARLKKEDQEQLDAMFGNMNNGASYIVEVRGFTDRTGDTVYNDRLSQRRSNEVVKYLVSKYEIPMHRIHSAGLGTVLPASDNKTRKGRADNRRVEVRIYIQDLENSAPAERRASSNPT